MADKGNQLAAHPAVAKSIPPPVAPVAQALKQDAPLAPVVEKGNQLAAQPATANDSLFAAVVDLGKKLAAAGAFTIGATGSAIAMDNRPPLVPASASGSTVIHGDTYHITIEATPGTNTAELRQMLNQLMDERERSKTARIRSRLSDQE
ncbi:hypothetical protein FQZ97_1169990 [compost metagenome]